MPTLFNSRRGASPNRQAQPSPWHRSRRTARRPARYRRKHSLSWRRRCCEALAAPPASAGSLRLRRSWPAARLRPFLPTTNPHRAGVVHKDIKAAESGKSLHERYGAAFGGRDIRRYAVDLSAPGLHRSNGFGDDFPAASADRHFRSLRQPPGSQPSSRTGRCGSQPMIDAGRRPGSSNTPQCPQERQSHPGIR
jgi:hypothetical protein